MSDHQFMSAFSEALLSSAYNVYTDNVDPYRFRDLRRGVVHRMRRKITDMVLRCARSAGFIRLDAEGARSLRHNLSEVLRCAEGLAEFYRSLADAESRQTLIALLAYRVLGSRRVKLPQNQPSYWNTARRVERGFLRQRRSIAIGSSEGYLNYYELHSDGVPVRLHAHHMNIQNTFALQQYRYAKNGLTIQAEPGDTVVDGGGCWGDTALYFAQRVGPMGRVICFEFDPENLDVMRANLEMNPDLAPRVRLFDNALWSRSDEMLPFTSVGPSTSVCGLSEEAKLQVPTLALDDLVVRKGVDRVDFVKLDIEGAELRAVMGAEQMLKRYRPKLAISLYHNLDDFVAIPAYLRGLDIGYDFYLDHFTIHHEETVLFAR